MLLNACAAMRPDPVLCGINFAVKAPLGQSTAVIGSETEATLERVMKRAAAQKDGPLHIELLALSAGGQFGAFGAGFLRGWSENQMTPRPDFDLVTGVSAGAIIAPVVFAGSDFDPTLEGYRGLSEDEVFRTRPLVTLLSASSTATVAPLESFVKTRLTDTVIDEVATRHEAGRGLLIMATDLDSTEVVIFDLGEMAASNRSTSEKRDCMTEAMLGSAAIPGLFPPRHIDGSLFADGGLRDQIFLHGVEKVRADLASETEREIQVNVTLIVNGSLRPPSTPTDEGLLNYALRSALILADEVLRDSIAEVVTFAEDQPGWQLRGILADTDLSGCDGVDAGGTFDPCVTERLFDDGRAKGAMSPIPWLSPDELTRIAGAL